MARLRGQGTPGQVFAVPLSDGSARIAQVIGIDWDGFEEPICAFTLIRAEDWTDGTALSMDDVMAVQTVTSDLLRSRPRRWRTVGSAEPLEVPRDFFQSPSRKFLDAPDTRDRIPASNSIVLGSGNMTKFLEACLGLRPWDDYAWPDYLDGVLLPGRARPAAAYMGGRHKTQLG